MKKLFDRIKRAVFARYDAAVQYFGDRSWIFQSYQDARLDIDAATRTELQRKHRYWVANSPLVQCIRNKFLQFTVGSSGLMIVPNSSEEDWNHSRADSWEQWGRNPEISQRISFPQLTIQWGGMVFDDGEIFIHKVFKGIPLLETIEAHRVSTPKKFKEFQGRPIIDGVEIDSFSQPVAYWVIDYDLLTGKEIDPRRIPVAEMFHKFKVRRPGQLRGIPEGFSGMNMLHDYDDLHKLEMQAAKIASSIGNVVTTPHGELDTSATRRSRMQGSSVNADGLGITKNSDQFYNVKLGAQTVALRAGDSVKNFQVDRPSVATQNYWDTLHTLICCSYNVPKLLVMPYSLQGTVTRADLDVCAGAFRMSFEIIAELVRDIYEWQTGWAVRFDRSMDGKRPADYLKAVVRPPRAPNVDIGYTATALQTELQMGVKTIQDVYAEKQQDWRTQLTQIAETRAFIKKLATKFGLEPDEISQIAQPSPEPATDGEKATAQTA
jgi:hypothetical protein